MVGVGRDLWRSSSPIPLPKQVHLEQAAQYLVQAESKYLQRRRLHNLLFGEEDNEMAPCIKAGSGV